MVCENRVPHKLQTQKLSREHSLAVNVSPQTQLVESKVEWAVGRREQLTGLVLSMVSFLNFSQQGLGSNAS